MIDEQGGAGGADLTQGVGLPVGHAQAGVAQGALPGGGGGGARQPGRFLFSPAGEKCSIVPSLPVAHSSADCI